MKSLHIACFAVPLLVGLGAMLGCAPTTGPDTQPETTSPETCQAISFSDLIGQPVSRIDSERLPHNRRIVFASSQGLSFNEADRLTILVSSTGRITQVRCG